MQTDMEADVQGGSQIVSLIGDSLIHSLTHLDPLRQELLGVQEAAHQTHVGLCDRRVATRTHASTGGDRIRGRSNEAYRYYSYRTATKTGESSLTGGDTFAGIDCYPLLELSSRIWTRPDQTRPD